MLGRVLHPGSGSSEDDGMLSLHDMDRDKIIENTLG